MSDNVVQAATPWGGSLFAEQAKLLAEIAEISCSDPSNAADILKLYARPEDIAPELAFLRLAVVETVCHHLKSRHAKKSAITEFDVHAHFWQNLQSYLPGASRKQVPSDGKNIPDGWVDLNGELLPVEMKLGTFSNSGARQLRRYLDAYGASKGIAVAAEFTCAPDDRFICITHQVAPQ